MTGNNRGRLKLSRPRQRLFNSPDYSVSVNGNTVGQISKDESITIAMRPGLRIIRAEPIGLSKEHKRNWYFEALVDVESNQTKKMEFAHQIAFWRSPRYRISENCVRGFTYRYGKDQFLAVQAGERITEKHGPSRSITQSPSATSSITMSRTITETIEERTASHLHFGASINLASAVGEIRRQMSFETGRTYSESGSVQVTTQVKGSASLVWIDKWRDGTAFFSHNGVIEVKEIYLYEGSEVRPE